MRCLISLLFLTACSGRGRETRLLLAAYTAPREVYHRRIIPAFRKKWRERTGRDIRIDESYQGSGAQSRAIVGGFPADIAALALDPDIDRLVQAKLVREDWKSRCAYATTLVALAVRTANPQNLHDFPDLARNGIQVILPNPRISGGAMWNVAAIYGSARLAGADDARATELLSRIVRNVSVMDKGARESINTFEQGIGDVAVTYESEIAAGRAAGRHYDGVLPPRTLVIRCPIAVVDANVDQHGTREAAEAFVAYLRGEEAQAAFHEYGFRAPNDLPPESFTIEDLGGWKRVREEVFGPRGAWARATGEPGSGSPVAPPAEPARASPPNGSGMR
jgi:sulfate transport system substrate-binding protein